MFYRTKEAGKEISSKNAGIIQNIHDLTNQVGSQCGGLSGFLGGGMYESARVLEAHLPMNQSHDAMRGHLRGALMKAHNVTSTWDSNGPYVSDVFPEHVVYSHAGETYKRKYSVAQGPDGTDPVVTLSDPKKVHVAYVESKGQDKESMRLLIVPGDDWDESREQFDLLREGKKPPKTVTVTLLEGEFAVREGVTFTIPVKEGSSVLPKPIDIKIISPGWGSMAYYPEDVIKRDGPKIFTAGTPMYWNHATESEELERPEGDLNNMAAILTENARWDPNGAKGPGLYSKAKVFSDYATQVAEKGPHIGVSINALTKAREGEAEGKSGRIVEKFVHAFSADFVTKAGRGGAPVLPVQESQRGQSEQELETMTEKEQKDMQDRNAALEAENRQMREGQNRVLAVATVGTILKEAFIPFSTKVLDRACASPVMKEGKLDADWVKSIVADFSDGQSGSVTDLGEGRNREAAARDTKQDDEKFKESLKELGIPEAGLAVATNFGR